MRNHRFRVRPLVVAVLSLGLAACGNPVEHEEDHPIGLVVLNAQGQEAARINIEAATVVTGRLDTRVNATDTYQVFALTESGARVAIDGAELGLQAVSNSTAVATASVQSQNQLRITGVSAGATTVKLTLLHEGHAELARDVPILVAQ